MASPTRIWEQRDLVQRTALSGGLPTVSSSERQNVVVDDIRGDSAFCPLHLRITDQRVKLFTLLVLSALAVATSGCGVGYKYGTQSHNFEENTNGSQILIKENELDVAMNYHEFRLIDTTGLLMSGLVNSSRQYAARQEAIDNARYSRDSNGNRVKEVEYSYKPYSLSPGTRVIADFRISSGTPDMTIKDIASHGGTVEYYGFDVLGEFMGFEAPLLPNGTSALFFAVRIDKFDYEEVSDPVSFDSLLIDMTFGTSLGFSPIDNLVITGTAEIGILTPLLKLIIDDTDVSYLAGALSTEVIFYPISWLGLTGNATLGQLNDGERDATYGRVGIGLIAEFGAVR